VEKEYLDLLDLIERGHRFVLKRES
jgi:hypothetical protein